MSDEISQEDDGFEIASARDSLDSDPEAGTGRTKHTPPSSNQSGSSNAEQSAPPAYSRPRDESPLPAPQPKKPASLPRESLDGETIFAVGDEDKWSDDDGEGDERAGLVGKSRP